MGLAKSVIGKVKSWFDQTNQQKVIDLKKGEDNFRPVAQSPYGSGYDDLTQGLKLSGALVERFADYEEMDDYPEIASAIDIYADDATVFDYSEGKTAWIVSKDRQTKQLLDDLLHNRLALDNHIYKIVRTLVKYGNCYSEILANEEGVVGLNLLPPATMRRAETSKGSLVGYVQDANGGFTISIEAVQKFLKEGKQPPNNTKILLFEPWEVVHWRIGGKNPSSEYGFSVLEPARWIWRRLVMAEDTALVYKLTRAPSRFAFYVDVGDLPPNQAVQYVNQVKQQFKKRKLYSSQTGKLDFRVNPLSPDEDFWIPTRAGQESTRIDTISGADGQSVEDLNYFREKLFSALKVPKAYLGGEGVTNRASLAQEDVRFARSVMRIQREVRNGLRQICRLHLAINGIDPDKVHFEIKMSPPSSIFELTQLELKNAQADTASRLMDFFDKTHILQSVFDYSKEEAQASMQSKYGEQEVEARNAFALQAKLEKEFPQVSPNELSTIDKVKEPNYPENNESLSLDLRIKRLEESLSPSRGLSKHTLIDRIDHLEESLMVIKRGKK